MAFITLEAILFIKQIKVDICIGWKERQIPWKFKEKFIILINDIFKTAILNKPTGEKASLNAARLSSASYVEMVLRNPCFHLTACLSVDTGIWAAAQEILANH